MAQQPKRQSVIKRYCNRCNEEKQCNRPCLICGCPEFRFVIQERTHNIQDVENRPNKITPPEIQTATERVDG